MDSFYIVLPSNDASYEENKTSNFKVRLPEILELDSSWTVALSSIIYPLSFATLGAEDEQSLTITHTDHKTHKTLVDKIVIPQLVFHNVAELEKELNDLIRHHFQQKYPEWENEREEILRKWREQHIVAKGGGRLKRAAENQQQLQPVQESPENQRLLEELKAKREQQRQLDAANRAVDAVYRELEEYLRYATDWKEKAENKKKTMMENIQAKSLNIEDENLKLKIIEFDQQLTVLRENQTKAQEALDQAGLARLDIETAIGEKNVRNAKKAADRAKATLKNLKPRYPEMALMAQDEVLRLTREIEEIIERVVPPLPPPPPETLDQQKDGQLVPIEKSEEVKAALEQLKAQKAKQQEKPLTQIIESPELQEQLKRLQQQKGKKQQLVAFDEEVPSEQLEPPTSLALTVSQYAENRHREIEDQLNRDPYAKVVFYYNRRVQKFIMFNGWNVLHVQCTQQLSYVLGYQSPILPEQQYARWMPNLTGDIRALYVYSPIIEQSIVGGTKAPLLRIVNVVGEPGSIQESIYSTEFFHRLQTKRISEISVEIRSSTGRLIPFQWGNTVICLHFRRSIF